MKSLEFRREREASWLELEELLKAADRSGLRHLPPDDLARLPGLYRGALASLAVARAISLDTALLAYLEGLCARAWIRVYARQGSLVDVVKDFLVRGFPRAMRAFRRYLAVSAALLLLGVLGGFRFVSEDVTQFEALVSPSMAGGRSPYSSTAALAGVLEQRGSALTVFAMFLFSHNAQIGLMCAALGVVAALPTIVLLFQNGATLGAFAALYHSRDLGLEFWAWVLPHGVTELGAVVVCGAAGLAIGESLLFPGRTTRLRSAAERGKAVAPLILGAVLMFFVAGLIEGIFRQTVTGVQPRLFMVVATSTFWALYLIGSGHEDEVVE